MTTNYFLKNKLSDDETQQIMNILEGRDQDVEANGSFLAVRPTDKAPFKLLAKQCGVELHDDLHCTTMFSPSVGIPEIEPSTATFKAKITGLDMFGEEKNVLVARLESPQLNKRHNELKAVGLKYTWDDYLPHVTLSYKFDGNLPAVLSTLGEPIDIVLAHEYHQPIDKDYA